MRRTQAGVIVATVLALTMGACGSGGVGDKTVTVLAASSLTDAFEALAEEFAASESGIQYTLELVFAGSSAIAAQLAEGAPADVVATADEATMGRIEATGRVVGNPSVFAENSLVLAVYPESASRVGSLSNLADSDVLVALCAPQVPCGKLAQELLAANDVTLEPVTNEPNVRSVLTKVMLGEVDAGLVYATDVVGRDRAEVVVVVPPGTSEHRTRYPIATLSPRSGAAAFTAFVLSPRGAEVLQSFGFQVVAP